MAAGEQHSALKGAGRRMLVAKLVQEFERARLAREGAREMQDRVAAAIEGVDLDRVLRIAEGLSLSGRDVTDARSRRRTG
jgi:hypothetical protein